MKLLLFCKLCDEAEILRESHIIPRSFFRASKRGSGQLIVIDDAKDSVPIKSNADWKEPLFCDDCEQKLRNLYEDYGTVFLRKPRNAIKKKNEIIIKNLKYKKYYLFLLSILWRASLSTLSEFKNVSFPDYLNEMMKKCIKDNALTLSNQSTIDELLKISVLRVVDSKFNIDDSVIKSWITSFGVESNSEGTCFFFMVEGFLITFLIHREILNQKNRNQIVGHLKKGSTLTIPKAEISDLKQIYDFIRQLVEKSRISNFVSKL